MDSERRQIKERRRRRPQMSDREPARDQPSEDQRKSLSMNVVGLRHALKPPEQTRQPGRSEQEAEPIERVSLGFAPLGDEFQDERDPDDAEREIEKEVPAPAQIGRDETSEH